MEILNKVMIYVLSTFFILLSLGSLAFLFNNSSKPIEYLNKDKIVREYMNEISELQDMFATTSVSNSFIDTDAKTLLKMLSYSEHHRLVIRRDNVPQNESQVNDLILKLQNNQDVSQVFQVRPILNSVKDIIGIDYKSSI